MSLKKIKIIAIILIFINIFFCSCFNKNFTRKINIHKYSIGMLVIEGGLEDKSFNELTYKGLLKAQKEYGIKINIREVEDIKQYQNHLNDLARNNDLIYAVGSNMQDAVEKIANKHTNKSFILIDAKTHLQNVKSITFKDEEGAFLVGIIAGKMSKTNKVGFVGGTEEVPSQKLKAGYITGVNSTNPNAVEDLINMKTIRYVGNFTDIDKAYNLAKYLYDDGCDIIYNIAGLAGVGVFKAAKETGKFVIGSEQDQYAIFPEYKDVILSSMVEKLDEVVYETVSEYLTGEFKGGLDNKLELGIEENKVGIAESTKNKVPKEILNLIEEYKKAIINKKILIPKKLDEAKEFKRQVLTY